MKIQLISIVVVLLLFIPVLLGFWHTRRGWKRIPTMTTEDLRSIFNKQCNFAQYNQAINELKTRGEDITFALPCFIRLALSRGSMGSIGRGCLMGHYSTFVEGIGIKAGTLSEDARQQLEELLFEFDRQQAG
jgi:hypothetical protein